LIPFLSSVPSAATAARVRFRRLQRLSPARSTPLSSPPSGFSTPAHPSSSAHLRRALAALIRGLRRPQLSVHLEQVGAEDLLSQVPWTWRTLQLPVRDEGGHSEPCPARRRCRRTPVLLLVDL
uniref:Uncharacterized protein n=1 Tax=Triticum urartu TaxID=4572 RepID=A0A8R7QWR2_TRIUA